jgi:hypothetical protein
MVWADTLLTPELSPQRLTPGVRIVVFGVWLDPAIMYDPVTHSVTLPLLFNSPRLSLEIFRGEPAISEFD